MSYLVIALAEGAGPPTINKILVVLTWVVFVALLAILYKFAFKPILNALEDRENKIRQSLDDANQARMQLEQVESTRAQIISDAEQEAKDIIQKAREGADEAARNIKDKAKQEAQILVENAERDISEKENQARARLRGESADLAISLASKIVGENLDDEKNRSLTDKLIKEI